MPHMRIRTTLLLGLCLLALPVSAIAQVTATTPSKPAPGTPASNTPAANAPAANTPAPKPPQAGTTIRPNTAPVQPVPPAAPAAPVVPPPLAVPTRPPAPVVPALVAADAPGVASPLPGGVRITFGPGRSDLNPATEATIRAFVKGGAGIAPAPENASFTITSFAAATPDDPSTARRISLARALAVRSVLISQGIASVRIYPKAQGPNMPGFANGPPDRADLIAGPPVLPPTPPPAAPVQKTP